MQLTKKALNRALDALCENGYLDLRLSRISKHMVGISLVYEGDEIVNLGEYDPVQGDFVVSGLKVKLELESNDA